MAIKNLIDFRGGYSTNVPPELMADNELKRAENCNWRDGLVKRKGASLYAAIPGTTGRGGKRVFINETWYTILAVDDGVNVHFYAGTETAFTVLNPDFHFQTGCDVEFAALLGEVVAVNGYNKPAVIRWDSGLVIENLETYDTREREPVNWFAGQWQENILSGYQECGLSDLVETTETGLAADTQYYFRVAIDGGAAVEYSIATGTVTTFATVIALMNLIITGAVFALVGGDLRCTSNSRGAVSAISLSAGTTGTDLYGALTGFTAFETPDTAETGSHFVDATPEAQDSDVGDFQIGNDLTNDGFYVACDFTFNKIVLAAAAQATGAPVAAAEYYGGASVGWVPITLLQAPAWTGAAGDRILEFDVPLDPDGVSLPEVYDLEDPVEYVQNKFLVRVRFSTPAGAPFSCSSIGVFHTQYLTEVLQDERPHLVVSHNQQVYMAAKNIINFSPPNKVTGWRPGQAEYFIDGGEKITGMEGMSDALVVAKENTLYTWTTSNLQDPIRSRPLTAVGCVAPRSFKKIGSFIAFLAKDGLYLWEGSQAVKVSKHIRSDFAAWTLANACAVAYNGEYWVSFPSNNVTLVFDPDTYRTDDMGDGRVSFYKYTPYRVDQFMYCNGEGDNGYLIGIANLAVPLIARADFGETDNFGAALAIDMRAQTKYYSFGSFQVKKHFGRMKIEVKKVSAHSGERHKLTLYSDNGAHHVHTEFAVPKGDGYHTEEIRMPYVIDGRHISIELRHNRPTSTTFIGFALETYERSF